MKETEIAWTDSTFNPWWGCTKVSDGCKNCYAETFAKRVGLKVWGATAEHRRFGDKHWNEPLKWNEAAAKSGKPHRVFCASMADVFEGRDEDHDDRERLWDLIHATPHLTWLLLTKRPENMRGLAPWDIWPRNVWAGCTVENRAAAAERIEFLLRVPVAVRFLSMEPLLEDVDVSPYLPPTIGACGVPGVRCNHSMANSHAAIDWVIVGGESGHHARPFLLEWAQSIVRQCAASGVPCFVKQMGANAQWQVMRGHWTDLAWPLKDRKGGDMNEWPAELRVRQWPEVPNV